MLQAEFSKQNLLQTEQMEKKPKKQAALRETVYAITAVLTHNNWNNMPK